MNQENRKYVFISHSHQDKAFARQLDATLSRHKVDVFIDDRDIKIGDSIPSSIYAGLGRATHLLYIISKNSVQSAWVREELDIAKMRQNEQSGFKILPLVIDDATLPYSVSHLKHADFRTWQDPGAFARSMANVLLALDVDLSSPGRIDIAFYIGHIIQYNQVESLAANLAQYILGVITSIQGYGKKFGDVDPIRWALKIELDDGIFVRDLKLFIASIRQHDPNQISSELMTIGSCCEVLLPFLSTSYRPTSKREYAYYNDFTLAARRLSDVMRGIRLDIDGVLSSGEGVER